MLKKHQRLDLSRDFKRVAAGKRIETVHFILFILREKSGEIPKVGIALAKKNFRKAHMRNRARRLSSTALQSHYNRLIMGTNLVIMPKTSVLKTSVQDLSNEIGSQKYLYTDN